MSPPFKRRRLSASPSLPSPSLPSPSLPSPSLPSPSLPSPSRSTASVTESTAGFVHSVAHIPQAKPTRPLAQPVSRHIKEIHLRIQERAADLRNKQHREHRRQDGTVTLVSSITTVDAAGNTIVSTVTNALPTVTTPGTAITSTSGTAPNTSTTSSKSNNTSNTSTEVTRAGTAASSTNSSSVTSTSTGTKGGATLSGTGHNNGTTTNHATSGSTTLKGTFIATLKGGHVKTLTRFNKPYVTSFADGQKTTICDRQGDCQIPTNTNSQLSDSISTASTSLISATSGTFAAGAGTVSATSVSPSATSTPASHNNNTTAPPPGTIAGGVVGGAAGIAVILLIALVFLRWYKRRSQFGHHALPPSASALSMSTNDYDDEGTSSRGPGMAERAGLMPFVSAVPALFRHGNRSRDDTATTLSSPTSSTPGGERGFTRVSGRKLPSAFSEGMTSPGPPSAGSSAMTGRRPPPPPPPPPPRNADRENLSGQSFYRDSQGFYGGTGQPTTSLAPAAAERGAAFPPRQDSSEESPSPERGSADMEREGEIALSPGPRRTPTVHQGGPYVMGRVPSTPNLPDLQGAGSRNATPTGSVSRFAEEI